MLTQKQFAQKAIENGHNHTGCKGWDWIRDNISELDYIFQSEEYKQQDGYIHKCLPIILKDCDDFTETEKDALNTAWYLNNERISAKEKQDKITKFNENGFFQIENDKNLDNKKIEFIIDNEDSYFGGISQFKGKLSWFNAKNLLMAMPSRNRRRGYWISPKVFVKFL